MGIAPENDAAKRAKREAIMTIMRDTSLGAPEKQRRIQALRTNTAPDRAVDATTAATAAPERDAKKPAAKPDATCKAADAAVLVPESAPGPPSSPKRRVNGDADGMNGSNHGNHPCWDRERDVKPSPTLKDSPGALAARKRRDEVMKSATTSGRSTRAGTGIRTGAGGINRKRRVARIGRASFTMLMSGEEEEEVETSTDTAIATCSSRRRGSATLADIRKRAGRSCDEPAKDEDDLDTKPAASRDILVGTDAIEAQVHVMSSDESKEPAATSTAAAAVSTAAHAVVTSASAPSPVQEDRSQSKPGIVAVSAIDEQIARKQSWGMTPCAALAIAPRAGARSSVRESAAAAATTAPSSAAPSNVRVRAYSCTALDDKIARKTSGRGRRAGASSAFSSVASRPPNSGNNGTVSVNTGARSRSMMPSRSGSLDDSNKYAPRSRSVSSAAGLSSRRERRRGVSAEYSATTAAIIVVPDPLPEGSNDDEDGEEEEEDGVVETSVQSASNIHEKPARICCKECGRPYTPPDDEAIIRASSARDLNSDVEDCVSESVPPLPPRIGAVAAVASEDPALDKEDWVEDEIFAGGEGGLDDEDDIIVEGEARLIDSGDWGSRHSQHTSNFVDDDNSDIDLRPDGDNAEEDGQNGECCSDNDKNFVDHYDVQSHHEEYDDLSVDDHAGSEYDHSGSADSHMSGGEGHDAPTVRRGGLELGQVDKQHSDNPFSINFHSSQQQGNYSADPYHYSGNFIDDEDLTRSYSDVRKRGESFVDPRHEGFVLSRDDKCNLCIGLLLIIIVTVGVSVPVTLIKKEKSAARNASTMSHEYNLMLTRVVEETGTSPEVFADESTPQAQALDWIAYDDPASLTADSPNFIQRYSLMVMYYGSGGSSTGLQWDEDNLEDDECNWYGVGCNNLGGNATFGSASGNVTLLELQGMRLAGSLVTEIGLLAELETLNIAHNMLSGGLPSTLFDLSSLIHLNMERNQFGPYLTEGIGRLAQLETLSLHDNRFENELPSNFGDLVALKKLYLHSNAFAGTIFEYMIQMPLLEEADNANNKFTGTILPSIGSMSNLRILLLGRNEISGTIPKQIGQLNSLKMLGFNSNPLFGSLPVEIGRLTSLNYLNVAMCGISSSLPSELGNLELLQRLELQKNDLYGTLPPELGKLANLQILNLMSNSLNGTIPAQLGQCKSLVEMQLQRNDLTGTVSDDLCALRIDPPQLLDDLRVDCVNKLSCPSWCCTVCK